jgi:hypothetical protein
MAKAKTPRSTETVNNKQVITMPESTSAAPAKKLAKPVSPNPSAPTPIDFEAQVRQRAYEIYQERGSISGYENEDWLQAEQDVRAGLSRQHSA